MSPVRKPWKMCQAEGQCVLKSQMIYSIFACCDFN